jgi:hypothetical protein
LAWQVPLLLHPGETGFRFVSIGEMAMSLFITYSMGVLSDGTSWILVPYIATSSAFVLFLIQRGPGRRSAVILLGWLLFPIIGLYAVSSVRPLFTARYLIFVLPSYLLLLACGVLAVSRHSRLLAACLLAALLAVNSLSLFRQATTPIKADLRGATRYVAARWSDGDLVIFQIPHSRYSFDYYLQRLGQEEMAGSEPIVPTHGEYQVFLPYVVEPEVIPYRWAEGLYTNAGMAAGEVDQRMTTIVSGSRTVWLVATEAEMWDKRDLVRDWLEEHAVLADERQFVRVAVYRYELR